ncbi:glycoside hydrolase family 2 protein [Suillus subluteus]|nr:glycoside hydrolase family 2 protein [Suillus subluteus]
MHPNHDMMGFTLWTLLASSLAVAQVFDLSELQWTLKNQNGSIVVPGSLPSQAHLDLFEAGIINDPLLGINEFTERWVINDNWTYTADLTPFTRTYQSDPSGKTLIVFYGIDTIANIFRRYTFDVSHYLSSPAGEDNNLTIALESAWYYGLNVSMRPDAEYFPTTPIVSTEDNFEYPNVRVWIRKINDDFGWDWGPAFVPSGVYKPAYIVTLSESELQYPASDVTSFPVASRSLFVDETALDIYKYGQNSSVAPDQSADWIVNVTFDIHSIKSFENPTVTLSIPELNLTSGPLILGPIPNNAGQNIFLGVNWSIPDSIPERWYPIDLGNPKLYNLTITLDPSPSQGDGPSAESITQTITTGFRTIQLLQTPYSEEEIASRGITPGDQWHFAINGRAFYSKGTNIIPFDPFYSRIKPEAVRWVLESAVKSGQNMLRVWGGGIYQPSNAAIDGGSYAFYSLCDELGILAWSELTFSDSLAPINHFLLQSIQDEVGQNVRRVNRHPSNVQWAGGNEIEDIVMAANISLANGTHYLDEFVYMFQDYLHDIVVSETNSVPYTDCSTTRGVLSLDPYVLRFANGTPGYIYGNTERYNYNASEAFDLTTYPVARFHSMPSFYSWKEVLENLEDYAFNSSVVMSRDHHPPAGNLSWPNPNAPQGQYQMTSAVELWLPTPGTSDSNQTFAQWCWSTQLFQSMNMVAEIAWYRRGAGLGENNLGSLVWQLNDIWQGVSWSAIEYSGRWKVLQYGMATVYSPVIINPFWFPGNESLTILATSDRWETVNGTAQLTWYDWSGNTIESMTTPFSIPTLNNSLIYEGIGLDAILPFGYNAKDVWLLMNVTATVDNKLVTSESYFTPVSLAYSNLVDPQIAVIAGDNYTFTLSAKGGVGAWTWLDHPSGTVGYFLDPTTGLPSNGYYLIPGIDRTVQFISRLELATVQSPDPADFVVRSLWNNTHI